MTLVYDDGVFKPRGPVPAAVKNHAVVHVVIVEDAAAEVASEGDDDSTGWATAMELKGCIDGGPGDVARNHDKYLYDKA